MGRIQSGLKRLYVPLGVIAAVCVALSWYYFGWVASERDYFRKRDFRQLATLSEQIRQKVGARQRNRAAPVGRRARSNEGRGALVQETKGQRSGRLFCDEARGVAGVRKYDR